MILFIIQVKKASKVPSKIATAIEVPITSKVYFQVSSQLNQETFFISVLTSERKVITFLKKLPILIF